MLDTFSPPRRVPPGRNTTGSRLEPDHLHHPVITNGTAPDGIAVADRPSSIRSGEVRRGHRRAADTYPQTMPGYVWIIGAVVTTVVVAALLLRRRIRSRRPLTTEEKLRAARQAGQWMRRSSPRTNRDHFNRGDGTGDRHSGALLENSFYGDMAGGGSGSGSD
jgi:hypothetical protein